VRTAIITALCGLSLSIWFSSPAAAQSNSPKDQLPVALSRNLSLSSAFPAFQPQPQSGNGNVGNGAGNGNRADLADQLSKDKAMAQLKQQLETRSAEKFIGCAHILIYVAPVTDTKMIIKVPEGAASVPTVPNLSVCREDLRRVDAPLPAPRVNPNPGGALIPLRAVARPD
jgi:hypothetical protein